MPTPFSASIRPRARRDGTIAHDVRFRHDGKQSTKSFIDAPSAQRWANILRQVGPAEALALLASASSGTSPTVTEYAETYIASRSGNEPRTSEDYRTYMRLHINPAFGPLPIDAVTPDTIARWVNKQTDAGNAAKSIKNRHGFLSAMFQAAVDDGLITRNPCAHTGLPDTESGDNVFLSWDEFTILYGYIPEHYKPLVMLLATTALRWGEATALKPSDVDLKALTLRVSRAWKYSKGRGHYIGPPKTPRAKRTVSFPADLTQALQPLMGGEWLFTNPAGKPIRQSNFFNEVWEPARRLANGLKAYEVTRGKGEAYAPRTGGIWDREPSATPIGKSPRVHDLRHSHASWLIARGVPMITVQRRLGHESVMTTEAVYSHLSPDMLLQPANVMSDLLAIES